MGGFGVLSAARKQGFSCDFLIPAVVALEAVLVLLAGILAAQTSSDLLSSSSARDVIFLGSLLGMILTIACLKSANTYLPKALALNGRWPLRVVCIGMAACLATGLAMMTSSVGLTWVWAVVWALYVGIALAFSRMIVVPGLRSWVPAEGFDRLIAVVGSGSDADSELNGLDRDFSSRFDRQCRCQSYTRPDDILSEEGERWVERLHDDGVEEVVILPSLHNNREWIHDAVKALEVLPIRVSLAIPRPALDSNQPGYVYAALIDQPLSASEQAVKRVFDALTALLLLIFLAPLMLLTAALIRLESSGPIFFKQARYGFGKKIIQVYKFRSMYHEMSDQMADRLTERDDPRVTRVGAFIRRFSIDELPQLINVLFGTMSLVGPRPLPITEQQNIYGWHRRRLSMKPGITGIWQVSGRNNIDFQQWMTLDLAYIDNWSLWLDIKLLLKTVYVVLLQKGAK
jgi:exopolysaccharide biosynthesis polyprenyl glycosylphosphotransferase